jgi:hypothetical protein
VKLYFRHKAVKDIIHGKLNVTMAMSMSIEDSKYQESAFQHYLDQEKVYVNRSSIILVDARMIGVFLPPNGSKPHILRCPERKLNGHNK